MDLTPDAIVRVVYPTAAVMQFCPSLNNENKQTSWDQSQLNPKNRIDSLEPVARPRWRIDGSCGLGTQFYTIPLFVSDIIPIRIDTFIPDWSACPLELRKLLEIENAFHCRDTRVARLGISQHILRALEHWTDNSHEFANRYRTLPFGSRIVFKNLAKDKRDIEIGIVATHDLERQFLTRRALQASMSIPLLSWPPPIDISNLRFIRQLHDSICLIQISTEACPRHMVFKALNSPPKYLYHELKNLLSIPPHPNIISRPQHLVTKRCGFGAKTAVVGFTLEYHPLGTLRDILPHRRIHGSLKLADQLRWSIQLTSALIHIQNQGMFYTDLRLDNILLSEAGDLVMVDFEQRGVWCTFSSPEINYHDYMHMLACSDLVPQEAKARFRSLLDNYVPGWKKGCGAACRDLVNGHLMSWMVLSTEEREAAEVYMLGRVLWGIFEGCSMPESSVWYSCRHEDDLEFPNYSRTPQKLRRIIDDCTKGRQEWEEKRGGGIVRKGNRLVLRDGDGSETEDAVQAEATRWWQMELERAEEFLEMRWQRIRSSDARNYFGRPTLRAVLRALQGIDGDACKP
jgi:Protein tyrosine and serine/threonine kinase